MLSPTWWEWRGTLGRGWRCERWRRSWRGWAAPRGAACTCCPPSLGCTPSAPRCTPAHTTGSGPGYSLANEQVRNKEGQNSISEEGKKWRITRAWCSFWKAWGSSESMQVPHEIFFWKTSVPDPDPGSEVDQNPEPGSGIRDERPRSYFGELGIS